MRLLTALLAAACLTAPAAAQDVEMYVPEGAEGITESFRMAPAIRAGDFVFISGVVGYLGRDQEASEDAYEAAIRDTFQRVAMTLDTAGVGWEHVVEMTTFHVDMREHQDVFVRVREEFVQSAPYPAWTAIGVDRLWTDNIFVEIRVVAYLPAES